MSNAKLSLPLDARRTRFTWGKRFLSAFLILLLLTQALAPLYAREIDLVTDAAGLLSTAEREQLDKRANAISSKYACEVAIITVDAMEGYDVEKFTWSLAERYDMGHGQDKSILILLLSLADRDYALVAQGYGNTAFTDHGKDVMLDDFILPLLAQNRYYEAFVAYLNKAEEYLGMAREGFPFDVDTDPVLLAKQAAETRNIKLAVTLIVPLVLALVMCTMWSNQMRTAVMQKAANQYITSEGLHLSRQEDTFLYRTQTSRTVQTSSSSSRGGTTTRGGRSGRSGKF